jgi:glycosyltransferase involved in cell wall biosynthesis
VSTNGFEKVCDKKVDFEINNIPVHKKFLPGITKKVLLNYYVSQYENNIDIVINSTNNLLLQPKNTPVINYIHYPDIIGIAEKGQSLSNKIYSYLLKAAYINSSLSRGKKWYCVNSTFTKSALERLFEMCSCNSKNIDILYPPVDLSAFKSSSENEDKTICSVGRFGKGDLSGGVGGQIEQVKIAQKMPSYQFRIIGSISGPRSERYYQRCVEMVSSNNIQNVGFIPNASFSKLKTILSSSKYYLHTRRREHFGITTAEAIASSTVPIVPNDGGQVDIVPIRNLRFEDYDEVPSTIRSMSKKQYRSYLDELLSHARKFSASNFRERFSQLLSSIKAFK